MSKWSEKTTKCKRSEKKTTVNYFRNAGFEKNCNLIEIPVTNLSESGIEDNDSFPVSDNGSKKCFSFSFGGIYSNGQWNLNLRRNFSAKYCSRNKKGSEESSDESDNKPVQVQMYEDDKDFATFYKIDRSFRT